MSFKDQLLKAGLVNKKQLRKSNQKAKKERKKKQGSRERQHVVNAREGAKKKATQREARAEKLRARRERERIREQEEAVRRVSQLLAAHRIVYRNGNQKFWYPSPDRRYAFQLELPESIAVDLHRGRLGLAFRGRADAFEPDVVIVPREIIMRIEKLDPGRILFHNPSRPEDEAEMLFPTQ